MKVKSLVILGLIGFASTVNAQDKASNLLSNSFIPLENWDFQTGPPNNNITSDQSKRTPQRPTAIKQRVRLSTYFSDGLSTDSTYYTFSGIRGSEPSSNYASNHYFDSTYQSSSIDNFTTLYPQLSSKYNSENQLILQNRYSKLGAKLGVTTIEYYNDNTKKKFQSIDHYEDINGSLYNDSMFVNHEYSATGKLLVSLRTQYLLNVVPGSFYNYRHSYYYIYDATDRMVSYEYKVFYFNNPTVDSAKTLMYHIYSNNSSLRPLKDSVVQTSYSGVSSSTTIYEYEYVYDSNWNLISSTTLKDGYMNSRGTFEFDASNNCVKQLYELFSNGWINSQKMEYSYFGNIMIMETYYYWDNNNQWIQSGKQTNELNNQGLIVTQKYYDGDDHLQSKEATEYTTYNNIAMYSSENYNNINGVDSLVASNVWNYYYDEFDDLSVSSNVKERMNWMLYPNPFNSTINLKIEEVIGNQKYELKIMEISGRILRTQQIKTITTVIPMQDYAPGIYFIILENKTKSISISKKVIKY